VTADAATANPILPDRLEAVSFGGGGCIMYLIFAYTFQMYMGIGIYMYTSDIC